MYGYTHAMKCVYFIHLINTQSLAWLLRTVRDQMNIETDND
jgi:hypothetical protein